MEDGSKIRFPVPRPLKSAPTTPPKPFLSSRTSAFGSSVNYEKYFEAADLTSMPVQAGKPGLSEEFFRTEDKKAAYNYRIIGGINLITLEAPC